VGEVGIGPVVWGIFADDKSFRPINSIAFSLERLEELKQAVLKPKDKGVELLKVLAAIWPLSE